MLDLDLINASLEIAAERTEDIAPLVYKYFYIQHPEAPELFGEDALLEGRMFNEVLTVVLEHAKGTHYLHGLMESEVSDHQSYGVSLAMYPSYFNAIMAAMKEVLGDDWTDAYENTWRRQFDGIMAMVTEHAAKVNMV